MAERVRLVDIARMANVTTTSASLALNGRPGVSDSTRERIVQLAREMGYAPHQGARALARGRSGLWGAWVSGPEEIWSRWLAGVLTQATARIVVTRLPSRDRRRDMVRQATAEARLDGCLVFDPDGEDGGLRSLWEHRIPTVITGRHSNWFDCVEIHEIHAFDRILDRISANGTRTPVMIASRAQLQRDDPRIRSWQRRMSRTGRDPELLAISEDTLEQGANAAAQLFARTPRPQAILCLSGDRSAAGILREAKSKALSVPEDIAVAGWGDEPFANWLEPELTSVSIPWEEAGIRAVLTLTRRFSRPDLPQMHRTLDARPVIRRSG